MDYHQDRFEDFSLMVFEKDKLVALVPANRVGNEIHSHQGLSYGGILLQQNSGFAEVLQVFKSTLSYLVKMSVEFLHLKLVPKIYHKLPSDEIDYLLFLINAKLTRRDLSETICLNKKNGISSNRKRGLKKAHKNRLFVNETETFDDFWNHVLIPNLQRKFGISPVHSLEEIKSLKSKFPRQIRQFNVYNDLEVVAGVTIFETEMVAHAQYISADENKQLLGSLDIAFDYLINEVYKNKPYFDFGISNEQQGKIINLGLLSWKESFGGSPIIHDFYEIQTSNYSLLDDVLK